jgi:ribose-phosphate pyrophosphokinase
LSSHFDWLVTVDPHLHRIKHLEEVYALRSQVVHAAPVLAAWITEHVSDPVIVGPDGESEQWARDVAERIGAPVAVVEKTRLGDTHVRETAPEVSEHLHHTPVILDDIISSGRTLVAAIGHLRAMGMRAPVCIAVHGLLAGDALDVIQQAGVERVVCTNTVAQATPTIDVSSAIAEGVRGMLAPETKEST